MLDMIRIRIQNKIKLDEQEEIIREEYDGELKKLAGKICLIYKNEQNEKILLKFDEQELVMTRYGRQVTNMKFHKQFPTKVNYEGLGELSLLTKLLSVDHEKSSVQLHYHIAQNDLKIADYQMQIDWEEIK